MRDRRKWAAAVCAAWIWALGGCGADRPSPEAAGVYGTEAPPGTHVVVSRGDALGVVNPRVYGVLEGTEALAAFEEAVATAERSVRSETVFAAADADYDIVLAAADGTQATYHLWLAPDGERGMLADTANDQAGFRLQIGTTAQLRERIGSIRYEPARAAANGDVVDGLEAPIHADKWRDFVRSVRKRQPASVTVVDFTIEGATIFHDLAYDGGGIRYRLDTTRDPYGAREKTTDRCEGVEASRDGGRTAYRLTGCEEGRDGETFELRL